MASHAELLLMTADARADVSLREEAVEIFLRRVEPAVGAHRMWTNCSAVIGTDRSTPVRGPLRRNQSAGVHARDAALHMAIDAGRLHAVTGLAAEVVLLRPHEVLREPISRVITNVARDAVMTLQTERLTVAVLAITFVAFYGC